MDLTITAGYVPGFDIELNLRELGGLPTRDGRHVRRGLFYRGSALSSLTPEQESLVEGFGLRYLLDLRARAEAVEWPEFVPAGVEYERIGGMRDEHGEEMDFSPEGIKRIEEEMLRMVDSEEFMRRLYVGMLYDNAAVHALVEHVVAGAVPVYFHCTAGKDRTGVSALVLGMLLGVTREAMLDDFLLTNEYRRPIIEAVPASLPPDAPQMLIDNWKKANGVNVEDAIAVLDEVNRAFGSPEAYLEREFGLSEQALRSLRDRSLE